ncbi:MAG: TIGR02587 family membrane protein [Microthrixaceae bacterium]
MAETGSANQGQWKDELVEVIRAVSGGLLFGVPLLYTMEIWWLGEHTEAFQMLLILLLLGVILVALNLTAGFRSTKDVRLRDAVADAIEALAIGLVVTAAVLVMLREITIESPLPSILGKVVNESVPFCLGIGVARFLLSGDPAMSEADDEFSGELGDSDSSDEAEPKTKPLNASLADLGAAVLGAIFIGLSIAPTDEIPMLASAMDPVWLVVVIAASLATSYAIVFVAGFSRQEQRHKQEGIFQRPGVETIVTYVASLIVAALLLWLFQRDLSPASDLLDRVVVLGFPAAIGGAAGRLAL